MTQGLTATKKLYSFDALSGFDMLWIMGLGEMILKFARTKDRSFWKTIAYSFEHPYRKNMRNIKDIFYGTLTNKVVGVFKQGDFADDVISNGTTTDFSN
ncbi:MAG: hypothetical protein JST10_09445 [Bacteroidetes bacterium]|nr:hypothetical protein [Bacteroidota bacterium]